MIIADCYGHGGCIGRYHPRGSGLGHREEDPWPYLWREWLTSVDHKRIGVMYLVLALVMLVRGFSDAYH